MNGKNISILNRTIVALDGMNEEMASDFLQQCDNEIKTAKIGMELFYKLGPKFVYSLKDKFNVEIFLDLKLHDIPNTVAGAIKSLEGLPVKFLTIHLAGGTQMIERAMNARDMYLPNCKLLGVTYLTSLGESDFQQIWGTDDVNKQIDKMLNLALTSKIDGIILSAMELSRVYSLEKNSSHELIKICPGIRFIDEIENAKLQDQKRAQNPKQAVADGATYLVVGRSLTKADNLQQRITELKEM